MQLHMRSVSDPFDDSSNKKGNLVANKSDTTAATATLLISEPSTLIFPANPSWKSSPVAGPTTDANDLFLVLSNIQFFYAKTTGQLFCN